MGSAQSSKLEKPKLENGYANERYVAARRSTGQALKPESRNESGVGKQGNHVIEMDRGRKSSSSNGDANDGSGFRKEELRKKGGEDGDEMVDGWPKWLVDNIPREVLRNIVPKSADSYTKIDKVGQGTYSNVYKARDKITGKIVALKKVRFDTSEPESVKFMAREIMILQKLDHPNIVKLEGLATSRMQYSIYLVFDYMQSDLARILSRPNEKLNEPQIKCYMQHLLSGLQHCHEKGILHRDIKGSNLLIDKNGMLKIADFGLANFFDPDRKRRLTSRVVTLWYRAPELLLGCNDYGVGVDLWSAGCLMAEMFAGRPIMPARTEVEQLHMIFKLCGTPPDDYYKRFKLSTALKPTQTYKSSIRGTFKNFPSHSLNLLNILLSLEPGSRGSASSALQNKFFYTAPIACDLSGLPIIHTENDGHDLINDRRKHRTSKLRRRSQSQREQRKKNPAVEKPIADAERSKKELQKSVDTSVFILEPGSSSTSNSSTSVNPRRNEEGERRLFPSPVITNQTMSPRKESTKNIKNRPPISTAKVRTTNYNMVLDGTNKSDAVQRSASTREIRSLEKMNLLN